MSFSHCVVCGIETNKKKWCNLCKPFQAKSPYQRKIKRDKSDSDLKKKILISWSDSIRWKWVKWYCLFRNVTLKYSLKKKGLQEEPISVIIAKHNEYLLNQGSIPCRKCNSPIIRYLGKLYCFNCVKRH